MARAKSPTWFLTVGICAVVSLASLVNVYGDNKDVEEKAKGMVCPEGKRCDLAQLERTPFSQTFLFRLPSSQTLGVKCQRSAIFFGEYGCEKR